MEQTQHQKLLLAADFFNTTARKHLAVQQRVHPATIISAMARMSGTLLYRSFDFKQAIEPGTAVLSDQANSEGPKLMNVMKAVLQQLGHEIKDDELDQEFMSSKHSQLSFKDATLLLTPDLLAYCQQNQISNKDAAMAAAIATGLLLHDCREYLPLNQSIALAVYGMVEGSKTAPYPSATENTKQAKPWYKFW